MFNLGKLFVEFTAQTKGFDDALQRAEANTKATADKIAQAGDFALGGKAQESPMKGAAADAGQMSAQIRAALQSAFAPMNQFAARFEGQFSRVGGTIITLARRIDSAMKFPATDAALQKLQEKIRGSVARGAAAAEGSLSRLDRAIQRLGPSADKAVGAFRGFLRIRNFLGDLGDVAGRPLQRMQGMNFSAPVNGAAKLNAQLGRTAPVVNAATTSVKRMGAEIALALGFFGLAFKAVSFFKNGIKGAIDLGETMSKTGEVFGKASGKVVSQADQMAKAFGLPKQALLDAAASFGLVAQASGRTKEQSADLANEMSRLAADASSFYNVPMDVALEKIRSGLVGEAEPMRAFGVLLSETAVQEEALALKLVKTKKQIDEQTKVIARASLIRKGLATATGDLERTQDSAANQFRKLGGGIENFSVAIGTALMPAIQAGGTALNELAATVIETFERNKESVAAFGQGLKTAFDVAGTLIRNFGTVWKIAELQIGEFATNAAAWIGTVPANLGILAEYVSNNWYQLLRDGFVAVGTLFTNLGTNLGNLAYAIYEFLKNPTQGFHFDWTPLMEGFQATAGALPELIKPELISVQGEIDKLAQSITDEAVKHAEDAQKAAKGMRKEAEVAKKAKDDFKAESFDFAEFARKLRGDQLAKKDDAVKAQTQATEANTVALEANTAAAKASTTARFA